MKQQNAYYFHIVFIVAILANSSLSSWAHNAWTQINRPGSWTVALYHCDDSELMAGEVIESADGNPELDLVIQPFENEAMESTSDVRYALLQNAIAAYSPQLALANAEVEHPVDELSIELFIKFVERGADIEVGLSNGIRLRIRISEEGDRFMLMGSNTQDVDDTTYSAPGFSSFPPVGSWHHYGVTISAQNIETLEDGTYRYGEGSQAQFFYESHVVGFINNTKLDISGLEFEPYGSPMIQVHQGSLIFDELMISSHDWSDPAGHDGASHGSISIGHAFENGRQPIETIIHEWQLFP